MNAALRLSGLSDPAAAPVLAGLAEEYERRYGGIDHPRRPRGLRGPRTARCSSWKRTARRSPPAPCVHGARAPPRSSGCGPRPLTAAAVTPAACCERSRTRLAGAGMSLCASRAAPPSPRRSPSTSPRTTPASLPTAPTATIPLRLLREAAIGSRAAAAAQCSATYPFGGSSGRPRSCHAWMPPAMLCASQPAARNACAAIAERAPRRQ